GGERDPVVGGQLIDELYDRLNDLGLIGPDAQVRWEVVRASGDVDLQRLSEGGRQLFDEVVEHAQAPERALAGYDVWQQADEVLEHAQASENALAGYDVLQQADEVPEHAQAPGDVV